MKLRFFCDNGANAFSCRRELVDTADLGLAEGEWEKLTDEQRDAHLKDWMSGHLEYGWSPHDQARTD